MAASDPPPIRRWILVALAIGALFSVPFIDVWWEEQLVCSDCGATCTRTTWLWSLRRCSPPQEHPWIAQQVGPHSHRWRLIGGHGVATRTCDLGVGSQWRGTYEDIAALHDVADEEVALALLSEARAQADRPMPQPSLRERARAALMRTLSSSPSP